VAGLAVVPGVVACVYLFAVLVGQGLGKASTLATVLGLPIGVVAAGAAVWAVVARPAKALVPPGLEPPDWVVERPDEAGKVVAALLSRRAGTVGITTALQGAGGFGKTTLATVVCADERVRRHFPGGIYPLVVGRDVRGASAIAAKVNDVIKLVAGEDATFTDPGIAGVRLAALLDTGRPRLLLLDDVWEREQLAPFMAGGRRCARLVTTRNRGLLAGRGTEVPVDQMSSRQALKLLTSGLPQLDADLVDELLATTGRWPLLLRLANKILTNAARAGADVPAAARQLLQQLLAGGPAVVDDLSGIAARDLDVGQPDERARAVRATIGASTSLLDAQDAQRFAELAIFAEDETIPFGLIARLWRATGGLADLQTSQVLARLTELALVTEPQTAGGVTIHDVVRDFLRRDLGSQRVATLNDALVEAVASDLPAADPLDAAAHAGYVAWWRLAQGDRYLCDHLIEHLLEAGRRGEAEWLAGDLRWAGARLELSGPAGPAADLSLVGTPHAVGLRDALGRAAHLLTPTEPARAIVDVLHSRLADDPGWGAQVAELRDNRHQPRLVNRGPLPDLPGSALRRVLKGHNDVVQAVAIAPDGSWLVTGSADGTARIWETATGREWTVLAHSSAVQEVAVGPDGSYMITRCSDGMAQIWDTGSWQARREGKMNAIAIAQDGRCIARDSHTMRLLTAVTGRTRVSLTGYTGEVCAIAVAPDGRWLATGSIGGQVQVWDAIKGRPIGLMHSHLDAVEAIAAAPNSRWLVTASSDQTARIWLPDGSPGGSNLAGHAGAVNAVAIAPNGRWLATGSSDRTIRIWDAATARPRVSLTGHIDAVNAVAIAPNGRWLATGSSDNTARIWDVATEQETGAAAGRRGATPEITLAPDGSWLAARNVRERALRIWDTASGQERAVLAGQRCAAMAVDGSWLATINTSDEVLRTWDTAVSHEPVADTDHRYGRSVMILRDDWLNKSAGTIRIWNTATWRERAAVTSHRYGRSVVVVARDGRWIATDSGSGNVQIWDGSNGRRRSALETRGAEVRMIAVGSDGRWLATANRHGGMIQIWDPASGRQIVALADQRRAAIAIAVAPDGSWLATSSIHRRRIWLWNAATWTEQVSLPTQENDVRVLAVASDSSWLATVSSTSGIARIWHIGSGQQQSVLTSRSGDIRVMAVAPDNSWFATTEGSRTTAQIWDTATGHQRAVLAGHHGQITAVAIAPGAAWLATGSDDRTVHIWDTATWHASALMRVEDAILACTWLGTDGLAVGGRAGLYLFDFLTDAAQPVLNTQGQSHMQ